MNGFIPQGKPWTAASRGVLNHSFPALVWKYLWVLDSLRLGINYLRKSRLPNGKQKENDAGKAPLLLS